MAEVVGGDILEGLLCPMCLKDQETISRLQYHFENEHKDADPDVLQSLKGLIGKAKKILKNVEGRASSLPREDTAVFDHSWEGHIYEEQEIGAIRSHTEYFKAVRNMRMDGYASETNKLIIRLHKLITNMPTDVVKRKAHERSIVAWVDDVDVKLCPNCARGFNIARRKHHCRLCGGIMCHDCSEFLGIPYAKKLTSPIKVENLEPSPSTNKPKSLLRRSNSASSLNSLLSVVDSVTGEPHIRICIYCKNLLDHRDQMVEFRTSKPILVQFYERLQGQIKETEELIKLYQKMSDSLLCGETTYKLDDANDLRGRILQLTEIIDTLSKRIAVLGTKDVESPPTARALLLQQKIRVAAGTYLRENVMGLPTLPTAEQLNKLQQERDEELLRLAESKQRERAVSNRLVSKSDISRRTVNSQYRFTKPEQPVSVDTGWSPQVSTDVTNNADDPLLQQIDIIRNFIEQARRGRKYDEVAVLEENLHELMEAYQRNTS